MKALHLLHLFHPNIIESLYFKLNTFYTITEAAKICSVNRSTMHRWVASGKIESYSTPGGMKRIQKSALKKFLEENQMPIDLDEPKETKKRILIVDDDISIQKYLNTLLKGPFMDIQVVSDGFEAGIKVMEFKPDLLVLDLNMPGKDGFEVCQFVKANPSTSHVKVLILTGFGTPANKEKAFEIGADGFLTKPAPKEKIIKVVERLLA